MASTTLVVLVCLIYISTTSSDISPSLENILTEMCPGYQRCNYGNETMTRQPSTNFVTMPTGSDNTCCFPCSCDQQVCNLRNNCCPSVLTTEALNEGHPLTDSGTTHDLESNHSDEHAQSSIHSETVCIPTSINIDRKHLNENETKAWSVGHLNLGMFMVAQCLPEVNDTRCADPDLRNMDESTPQTDSHGVTYRNIYCAHCHSATSLTPWKIFITCSSINIYKADDMLFPNTIEKMYKFALSADLPTCGINFMPPDDVNMTSAICLADESVISECNETTTNQSLIDACRTVRMPFVNSDPDGVRVYANVFCYLCSIPSAREPTPLSREPVCPQSFGLSYYDNNTFVAQINTGGNNETDTLLPWIHTGMTPERYVPGHVNCVNDTVFDPYTRECRKWYCPSGRMVSGPNCVPILQVIDKATFRLDLTLKPDEFSKETYNTTNKTVVAFATIDAIIGNHESIKKELVILSEEPSVPYLYALFLLRVVAKTDVVKSLFNRTLYENDVVIDGGSGEITMHVNFSRAVKIELSSFMFSTVVVIDMIRYTALHNLYRRNIDEFEIALRYPKINRLSFCTQVLLSRDEIRYYVDILDIRKSDVRLYEGEFLRTLQYETMRVCLSDYLRNVHYDMKPKPQRSFSPQGILSFICNLMSIVGLSITLITYVTFEELRSVPGKNNMMLSLHLLVAQCLYQFGMDKTDYPTACIVLGMLIHLFWLTAIFWMNACTLHMFRTFVTGQSYRSLRAIDPQVCGYACYCYGVAILMVSINVGISLYESEGKVFGYGGRICYITNPVMVGWTFALPVGVIIILNMSFFFAVVYQISASTMRRRGKHTDRANTVIYMKLSSLTGVTWIFGYLYLWTDFLPLEYIFIVLNAGQGVFIFISFICTKRITKMYGGLFRKLGRMVRETGACACLRKAGDSETTGVELNTAKVSLTAGSTSKGVLPSAIAKKIMSFPSTTDFKIPSTKGISPASSNGANAKLPDTSESDVFKESAAIAHALSHPKKPEKDDNERKHSRRTDSESLSDQEVSDVESSVAGRVICHTNVNMLPDPAQP